MFYEFVTEEVIREIQERKFEGLEGLELVVDVLIIDWI